MKTPLLNAINCIHIKIFFETVLLPNDGMLTAEYSKNGREPRPRDQKSDWSTTY